MYVVFFFCFFFFYSTVRRPSGRRNLLVVRSSYRFHASWSRSFSCIIIIEMCRAAATFSSTSQKWKLSVHTWPGYSRIEFSRWCYPKNRTNNLVVYKCHNSSLYFVYNTICQQWLRGNMCMLSLDSNLSVYPQFALLVLLLKYLIAQSAIVFIYFAIRNYVSMLTLGYLLCTSLFVRTVCLKTEKSSTLTTLLWNPCLSLQSTTDTSCGSLAHGFK